MMRSGFFRTLNTPQNVKTIAYCTSFLLQVGIFGQYAKIQKNKDGPPPELPFVDNSRHSFRSIHPIK